MKPLVRLLAVALLAAAGAAPAQIAYPDKPITMIVPFPPGGVADTVARPVAEALSRELKATVIVDNKVGAGGALGIGFAARAAADGYTLLLSLSSISILPEADQILARKPSYTLKQFTPIARFTADPTVLVVRADAALGQPGRLHRRREEEARHLQLRQLGQLRHDACADGDAQGRGRVPHGPHSLHRCRAGGAGLDRRPGRRGARAGRPPSCSRSRPANCARSPTGATSRWPRLPEVPSLSQLGYPTQFAQWSALFVPAGTPRRSCSGCALRRGRPLSIRRWWPPSAVPAARSSTSTRPSSRPTGTPTPG